MLLPIRKINVNYSDENAFRRYLSHVLIELSNLFSNIFFSYFNESFAHHFNITSCKESISIRIKHSKVDWWKKYEIINNYYSLKFSLLPLILLRLKIIITIIIVLAHTHKLISTTLDFNICQESHLETQVYAGQ